MADDDSGAAVAPPALSSTQQNDDQQSQQSATPSPQQAQSQRDDVSAPTKQDSEGEESEEDDQGDNDSGGDSKEGSDDRVPNSEGEDVSPRDDPMKKASENPTTTENDEPAVEKMEQQQQDDGESLQSKPDSSPSGANTVAEESDAAASGAPLSVETSTANANAATAHQPRPLGANRTPSGAHPMYPSFPVTGMTGTGQQPQPVVSPNHQLQFPYASSNFVAPMPTPIRPLHGDPRAITQQQQQVAVSGAADDANPDSETAASSSEGTSLPYPVPASRMFHHQTNSPSFYNTAQDGPPVGPSAVDPNFQKPWDGSANGTPAMNEPGWSNQGQQPAATPQVDPPRADSNKVCVTSACLLLSSIP